MPVLNSNGVPTTVFKGDLAVDRQEGNGPESVISINLGESEEIGKVMFGDRKAIGADFRNAGRSRLMVFGDSIAGQSGAFLHAATSTIAGGDIKAGTNQITVANGALFAGGDKIAIPLYHGELFLTTVSSVATNVLTVADITPGLIRNASSVRTYTTTPRPDVDLGIGLANGAVALLGGPVDVISTYGYGGASAEQMLADLDRFLRHFKPNYVVFHLFENSLVATVASGGATIEQLKGLSRQAAWSCVENGAVPIVCSSLPYNLIPASRAADYDALVAYLTAQLSLDVPGSYGVDCSTKWLDTSNPTYPRSPIAGVTDGVHPNVNYRFTAAELTLVPVLRNILPKAKSLLDYVLTSREVSSFAGTGGTAINLVAGSIVPAGHSARAFGTAVATLSRNADGSLKIVGSWPNAANRTSDYITETFTFTFPPVWAGGKQWVKGFIRFRCNSLVGISQLFPECGANVGELNDLNPGVDFSMSMPADGREIVLETPIFQVNRASTTINVTLVIRPQTLSSPANAVIDVDPIEMGIVPATAGIY